MVLRNRTSLSTVISDREARGLYWLVVGGVHLAVGCAVRGNAGLSRESLYKALSGERSPDFDTILKVVGALGLKLHAEVPRDSFQGPTPRSRSRTTKRRAA